MTILPDGTEVPWTPLSIGAYSKFMRDHRPPDEVEESIFDECVTDEYVKSKAQTSKAGNVSTVVLNVLSASAPSTVEEYQLALNYFRYVVHESLIDQMVIHICQAFSGYTPRDVYDMDLDEFMHTVALAERKLLDAGILVEPLQITPMESPQQKPQPEQPKGDTRQLREKWLEQQGHVPRPQPSQEAIPVQTAGGIVHAQPVPEWHGEQTIVTTQDEHEHMMAAALSDGHQANEMDLLVRDMINDTAGIYQDYVDMMQKGDKITPDKIKTLEQRTQELLEASKESEKKLRSSQEKQAEKQDRLEKLFQANLPKRKHKRRG